MTASILGKVELLTLASTLISTIGVFAALNIGNRAAAIVVPGDPNDYVVRPGTGYDGVVRLDIQRTDSGGLCTGSLLPTGLHILTAAHCFTQDNIGSDKIPGAFVTQSTKAFFDLPTGRSEVDAIEFYIHPLWNGDYFNGNDVAVIKLAGEAPAAAERYNLYRGTDEFSQPFTKVGYGEYGNGNTGGIALSGGIKLYGYNTYDAVFSATNDRGFGYDFNNGLATNDAFGTFFGTPNTGLGINEVFTAPGDSGGPGFRNGLIAGITSFRDLPSGYGVFSDIDNILNSTFGETAYDTRVSSYASYIDSVLIGGQIPTYNVPRSSTALSTVFTLGALAGEQTHTSKVPESSTVLGTMFALGALAINSHFRGKVKGKALR